MQKSDRIADQHLVLRLGERHKNGPFKLHTFYEFFAGGGMARQGLGAGWQCLYANDFDHKKAEIYRRNWGDGEMDCADVRKVETGTLPGLADLIWASFPCQDLSLAGGGAGLKGDRSGTFWPFWNLVSKLTDERRKPKMVVLENVPGTLTSHKGKDFGAIIEVFAKANYRVGAIVADAEKFVPQSRKRLFVIAVDAPLLVGLPLIGTMPDKKWSTPSLEKAHGLLSDQCKEAWVWWQTDAPPKRRKGLDKLLVENPDDVPWHTEEETTKLLNMMSDVNQKKVQDASRAGKTLCGTLYRRTRVNEFGEKVQRAEVRFDNVAGCLRTPAGGSSRQLVMVVDGNRIKSRLLSMREAARLMGLPDTYKLPTNYNEAYHLLGDGVAVPVVRFISENILKPILEANKAKSLEAA